MEEIAKLLVLGVLIAVAIAYVRLGPTGAKGWWEAKFYGHPMKAPSRGGKG